MLGMPGREWECFYCSYRNLGAAGFGGPHPGRGGCGLRGEGFFCRGLHVVLRWSPGKWAQGITNAVVVVFKLVSNSITDSGEGALWVCRGVCLCFTLSVYMLSVGMSLSVYAVCWNVCLLWLCLYAVFEYLSVHMLSVQMSLPIYLLLSLSDLCFSACLCLFTYLFLCKFIRAHQNSVMDDVMKVPLSKGPWLQKPIQWGPPWGSGCWYSLWNEFFAESTDFCTIEELHRV